MNRKLARFFGPEWPWLAAVVLAAVVAAWPVISQPGLLNTRGGGDSPFLLQRLHQLAAALADGHFPARWMPDANYGYGYPFYNYDAPLSLYVAAAFRFLGFSFVRAIHLAQLAGFVVAGLGMFHLGQRWLGSRVAGLLAAVAYTVAPFHMVNVYVRGDSLAEFWAMAFYPFVLLAAESLTLPISNLHSPLPRRVALFALAYAALILSHNISALIFTPFLLLYLLLRVAAGWKYPVSSVQYSVEQRAVTRYPTPPLSQSLISNLLIPPAALLLAFALAAWFFVPALAEQGLAQLGPVTEGYFHFSNHFRGRDLVQGGLLFDYNPDGGVAFRLGLAQVGVAVLGAVVLLVRLGIGDWRLGNWEIGRLRGAFVLFGALLAVFMITPLSRPLWDHLPLLPFTQFPWRFLSVASFFMALLTGGLVLVVNRAPARAAVAVGASIALLAAGLLGLRVDHLILTDADVTAERLAEYEWFTGNIGTTVSAEYLTPESSPRPWTSAWLNAAERDRAVALSGELAATLTGRTATRQTWRVVAGNGGAEARFPTLYWPGWRAAVDGEPAELRPLPSSGLMALAVPAGEHIVTLELGRTPVRLAAELVSLAALVVAAGLLVAGARRTGRGGLVRVARPVVLAALGVLLLALLWRNDPRDLPRGDLTWDFAQMGYLHHSPGGVAFGDGTQLDEYAYSADVIPAGETLTVTLSLTTGDAPTAALALVSPASARPTPAGAAEPPGLATHTVALDGDTAVFTLPIAPDAPAGLYVPRLRLDGARPLLPSGGTRGDLFLRPVRVVQDVTGRPGDWEIEPALPCSPAPSLPCSPTDALDVRAEVVIPWDGSQADGRFAWAVGSPLAGRYQVSWRLQDGDGRVLAQLDAQPRYGFQPTDAWLAGGVAYDWLALALPDALTGPPPHALVMLLYDATTGEPLLLRRVGGVAEIGGRLVYQPQEPAFALPGGITPLDVVFGPDGDGLIRLRGYELTQMAGQLEVALYWEAPAGIPQPFTRFVHLLDADGQVAAQLDGHPAGNSYPTGQWAKGEIVTDTLRLNLSDLPPGAYRLATGFYRPSGDMPRLPAFGAEGRLADDRVVFADVRVGD